MKVEIQKYSNHKKIKRKSFYFHFYNMSHCIEFVPYTNEDIFNISDIRFEYNKVAFFIPDEQHKYKLLKVLQKVEKGVKKYED